MSAQTYDQWLMKHPYPHIIQRHEYEAIQADARHAALSEAAELSASKFSRHFNGSKVIAGCEIADAILALRDNQKGK